jgi:homoserine dehydrogenase
MKEYRLCFLGFGNVGRALARLLVAKSTELQEKHKINWKITGVATRRLGWRSHSNGFDVTGLLAGTDESYEVQDDLEHWLRASAPDVVFETTSLNPESGQPAIDYLKSALEAGAHAITGGNGPDK